MDRGRSLWLRDPRPGVRQFSETLARTQPPFAADAQARCCNDSGACDPWSRTVWFTYHTRTASKLHVRLHTYQYQDRSRSEHRVAPAPDTPRDHHGFQWRSHLQISVNLKLP